VRVRVRVRVRVAGAGEGAGAALTSIVQHDPIRQAGRPLSALPKARYKRQWRTRLIRWSWIHAVSQETVAATWRRWRVEAMTNLSASVSAMDDAGEKVYAPWTYDHATGRDAVDGRVPSARARGRAQETCVRPPSSAPRRTWHSLKSRIAVVCNATSARKEAICSE
jgi:hypothetical protein